MRSAVREAFRVLTGHGLSALDPARSTSVAFAAVELRAAMKGSRVSYRAAARLSLRATNALRNTYHLSHRRVPTRCLVVLDRTGAGFKYGLARWLLPLSRQ